MKASGFIITLKASEHQPDDDIITNPQWLINHFCKIVKPPTKDRKQKVEPANWKMTKEELKIKLGKATSDETKETLILFMEHLGLLAKPRITSEKYTYFIPSQMEKLSEDDYKSWLNPEERNVSKSLTLDFRKNGITQIPFPHFDKLMKEIMSCPPLGDLKTNQKTRNGCILLTRERLIMYFLCHGSSVIKMTVFTHKAGDDIKQNDSLELMHDIIHTSKVIGQRFNQFLVERPTIGLSCCPFPPKEKKCYCTIQHVMEGIKFCCEGPKCDLVNKKDLEVFQGKKKMLLGQESRSGNDRKR